MLRRLISLALALALLYAAPVAAQNLTQIRPISATASLTTSTCVGSGLSQSGCLGINQGGYKFCSAELTGTWTGTVSFEANSDSANWVAVNALPISGTQTAVTTATANGIWFVTSQTAQFRVRFSTATSGTVVVTIRCTL